MDCSRRDLLKGLLKPDFWEKPRKKAPLPEGVDILLDKDVCIAWGKGICTLCEDVCGEHALFFLYRMRYILENRFLKCCLFSSSHL